MRSKKEDFIVKNEGRDSLDDVKRVFEEGKLLPSTKIVWRTKSKSKIPFGRVIATDLDLLAQKLDFDGEPFMKGDFDYQAVLLPTKRTKNFPDFYRATSSILNGFRTCTGADKETLISLMNELYFHYAPKAHITLRQHTSQREASFGSIERIVDQVINTPQPFTGFPLKTNIIWNPDYELSGDQKRDIEREYRAKNRKTTTMALLKPMFKEGLSKSQIVKRTGLSLSTVKRYRRKFNSAA